MSRRLEIDALRGLLLLLMALSHLPTRFAVYGNQPLGFVSTAEGFVFLSAFVGGGFYLRELRAHGAPHLRGRLWRRALHLYGVHLGLLAIAFTAAASFAALQSRPALRNLLSFYFDSPGAAVVNGSLLLYQPPLFDILPLYIVFLAATPLALEAAQRRGWAPLLTLSALVWAFAQGDGRRLLHTAFVRLTGAHLPIEATGAFDLLAWQLMWTFGLYCGAQPQAIAGASRPRLLLAAAAVLAFGAWRHRLGGFWPEPDFLWLLDKWHLGPLRLLNFVALAWLVGRVLVPALAQLRARLGRGRDREGAGGFDLGGLALLGRASLPAFVAHLLICLLALGLIVDEGTPLSAAEEAGVMLAALGLMMAVARHGQRGAPARANAAALPTAAVVEPARPAGS